VLAIFVLRRRKQEKRKYATYKLDLDEDDEDDPLFYDIFKSKRNIDDTQPIRNKKAASQKNIMGHRPSNVTQHTEPSTSDISEAPRRTATQEVVVNVDDEDFYGNNSSPEHNRRKKSKSKSFRKSHSKKQQSGLSRMPSERFSGAGNRSVISYSSSQVSAGRSYAFSRTDDDNNSHVNRSSGHISGRSQILSSSNSHVSGAATSHVSGAANSHVSGAASSYHNDLNRRHNSPRVANRSLRPGSLTEHDKFKDANGFYPPARKNSLSFVEVDFNNNEDGKDSSHDQPSNRDRARSEDVSIASASTSSTLSTRGHLP